MILSACVLAGLLARLLQGSTGGHMLLVEHTRCAEHGELVHRGDSHAHINSKRARADAAALEGTPSQGSDPAHHHCALSVDRRGAVAAIVSPELFTQALKVVQGLVLTDAQLVTGAARFRVAPKNSPPA
ncbi:MAG: hypothetical protein OES21_01390 [Myxococcales bacterium]|jgi:hypothetical protein|nr:hypothetical protein [Myxococcales bacterium]